MSNMSDTINDHECQSKIRLLPKRINDVIFDAAEKSDAKETIFGPDSARRDVLKEKSNKPKRKIVVNSIHGNVYHLNLFALFMYEGVCQQYPFTLRMEMYEAGKFDDLVMEYQKDGITYYRLVQVKHKINDSEVTINHMDLLSIQQRDFSLGKYLISYHKSKNEEVFKTGIIENVTVYTNADFNYKELERTGIIIKQIKTKNDILDLENKRQSKCYKFDKTIIPMLQQVLVRVQGNEKININENDIEDFLDHLVFAVNQPNEQELERLIKQKIAQDFKLSRTDQIYNNTLKMCIDIMKSRDCDKSITYEEAKKFFINEKKNNLV